MTKAEWAFVETLMVISNIGGFVVGCLALGFNPDMSHVAFMVGCLSGSLAFMANAIKEETR